MACVDGLKGFPLAIESVFPQVQAKFGIVHLVRVSLELRRLERTQAGGAGSVVCLPRRHRRRRQAGNGCLCRAMESQISNHWSAVAKDLGKGDSLLRIPAVDRKVIYTTNAAESLNMSLRKPLKTRAPSPVKKSRSKSCI